MAQPAEPAEQTEPQLQEVQDEDEDNPNYKVPEKKALDEMLKQDKEDESLEKYKRELLQGGEPGLELYPDRLNAVPVKLALVVEGRPDVEVDLLKDLEEIKKTHLVIKEGTTYRVKIYFYVQRDIVTGLKYTQNLYKKGLKHIKVDKSNFMVGSYPPRKEIQSYTTPPDEAPSGFIARGQYKVDSQFTDDDNHNYLKWEWTLEIKKDWKD
ncbi:rho GDP-dissociation inhibitor 1-like [Liolophura sinensis]|uniref:rho GDP-dissociation inhibitor 1-like n=1 Tax=Liolophura sinensis TaxID=3198878 RepID=UPI0031582C70